MKHGITANPASRGVRNTSRAPSAFRSWLLLAALPLLASSALAHHSFAVFFDGERSVTVRGTVIDFQFRNPHGIIRVRVEGAEGAETIWKAETNSPSILERRGWSKDSLKAGEVVIIDGWPARDGTHYMRMRTVKRADGSMVGTPVVTVEEQR